MATPSHARSTSTPRGSAAAVSPSHRRGIFVTETLSRYARPVPLDLADEDPPGSPEPWHLAAAVRPDTPHVRARRFLDALGDLLACLVLIGGGIAAISLASLF